MSTLVEHSRAAEGREVQVAGVGPRDKVKNVAGVGPRDK